MIYISTHLHDTRLYIKKKHSVFTKCFTFIIGEDDYFLPSNCCFKAAKASMSPKVVEAA